MLFSDLIFLFLFLPVVFLAYTKVAGTKRKNLVLLIASCVFYLFGGLQYLLLLFILSAVAYFAALLIEKREGLAKQIVIASVAIFLTVLGIFKYADFLAGSFAGLFRIPFSGLGLALPIGLSFYTFKLISYVIDVKRKDVEAEPNFFNFLLYSSLFHHIMAGPIVRYRDMREELRHRRQSYRDMTQGMLRFSAGLIKKAVFADHCGALAESFAPTTEAIASQPASALWLGALFFMLQIYLDFSAYSDMAIGLGQVFGFHFGENFRYPYTAVSVRDFWRRWHISLGTFFRDYVYIPLGGSRVEEKKHIRNLLIVWLLTGLWHGSSWNYLLWGLYFFAFLLLEHKRSRPGRAFLPPIFGHLYTLAVVFFGWIFFRFERFRILGLAIKGMITGNGNGPGSNAVSILFKNNLFFLIIAILCATPVFRFLWGRFTALAEEERIPKKVYYITQIVLAILAIVISVLVLLGSTYQPFLYVQY